MFLQILPPDSNVVAQSISKNHLLLVLLGLAIGVFVVLKIAKYLSKIEFSKNSENTAFTS